MLDEIDEEIHLKSAHMYFFSLPVDFSRVALYLYVIERYDIALDRVAPAYECADAHDELIVVEWLCHVVIGSELEP